MSVLYIILLLVSIATLVMSVLIYLKQNDKKEGYEKGEKKVYKYMNSGGNFSTKCNKGGMPMGYY